MSELVAAVERGHDLVALDDALGALAAVDERKARVDRAQVLRRLERRGDVDRPERVSVDTVMRDWKLAKVWLLRELRRSVVRNKDHADLTESTCANGCGAIAARPRCRRCDP